MAQLGHADARVTLSIYAQVVQRQATDQALIWRLMRFAGEPEQAPLARGVWPNDGPNECQSGRWNRWRIPSRCRESA
jgi:hypothetical protein